jgi:hypothetical protein
LEQELRFEEGAEDMASGADIGLQANWGMSLSPGLHHAVEASLQLDFRHFRAVVIQNDAPERLLTNRKGSGDTSGWGESRLAGGATGCE